MWGLTGGAWMLARSLAAAIKSGSPDLHRHAVNADFFGAHQLSRTASLAEALHAGKIL